MQFKALLRKSFIEHQFEKRKIERNSNNEKKSKHALLKYTSIYCERSLYLFMHNSRQKSKSINESPFISKHYIT